MNKYYRYKTEDLLRRHTSNSDVIMKDAPGVKRYLIGTYNCFGYAMGYYDWLDLESFYYLADEDENYDALDEMFEDCCVELEDRYNLTRIYDANVITSLRKDEHIIAFRVGFDDFHFARLNSDGTWSHKPGGNYIRNMSEEEFHDAWCPNRCYPYVSDIAYFIVRKGVFGND